MSFLPKLSRVFEALAVTDRESLLETNALAVADRDFSVTTQMDTERKATTITSVYLLILFFLFLFTFLGCMVARRNKPRLPSNDGNIEGTLIGSAAEANTDTDLVIIPQNQFEIEANRAIDHHDKAHCRGCLSTLGTKCNLGTQVALLNFLLEIPSAVFDQISSGNKPIYVHIVMLISFTSMLVCFVELVSRGRREKITWRCSSTGRIPWFYHPPPGNRPFGTLMEMIGLGCAIAQCIVTTINYSFCLRDHAAPIKISVWPIVFGFGMLCSKLMGKPNEARTDQDGGDVALDQPNVHQPLTLA
ncbi:uncharacterized protein LOC110418434 [Herrania umbratica]|uniref:Uncharacterized protein LOC110418434 n=1 Tax=Herrania umbratica TaxID=108875 RepID=A0A6J1AJS6_9ROSI|nr:uncharacterized protein LOC110418434 [Herrania umbratica]